MCYMKLLIATKNKGKLKEFKTFLQGVGDIELVSLIDLGISEDFDENGTTYAENSEGKARFYAGLTGIATLSDDGGIEIEALNFEPGIHSRRWLGHSATDEELIAHMIKVAKELGDNRTAYFRTVVSIVFPDGTLIQEKGEVKGIIAEKPFLKLNHGYPYRSFFYLPEIGRYYHESDLSEEQEKLYNHRYKAVQKLIPQILEKI